jgi:hypothetical protein
MRFIPLCTLTINMAFSVSHATAANGVQDAKAIEAQRQASNAAMAERDVETFVSFFDTDYIITYGGGEKVLSLAAETKSLKAMFDGYADVKYVRTPQNIYVSNTEPLAMENGPWIDEETFDATNSGRYATAWRKTDGVWKIHNELFITLECEGSNY